MSEEISYEQASKAYHALCEDEDQRERDRYLEIENDDTGRAFDISEYPECDLARFLHHINIYDGVDGIAGYCPPGSRCIDLLGGGK